MDAKLPKKELERFLETNRDQSWIARRIAQIRLEERIRIGQKIKELQESLLNVKTERRRATTPEQKVEKEAQMENLKQQLGPWEERFAYFADPALDNLA